MPIPGLDRKTYRANKFGSWAYSQQLDAQTIQSTHDDDVEFRYELVDVAPHTFHAQRLTWFATQQGQATTMAEHILKAYFTEGRDICDIDTLAQLEKDVELDQGTINSFLHSDSGTQAIRELEQIAIDQGVRSVPHIRIGTQTLAGHSHQRPFYRFYTMQFILRTHNLQVLIPFIEIDALNIFGGVRPVGGPHQK